MQKKCAGRKFASSRHFALLHLLLIVWWPFNLLFVPSGSQQQLVTSNDSSRSQEGKLHLKSIIRLGRYRIYSFHDKISQLDAPDADKGSWDAGTGSICREYWTKCSLPSALWVTGLCQGSRSQPSWGKGRVNSLDSLSQVHIDTQQTYIYSHTYTHTHRDTHTCGQFRVTLNQESIHAVTWQTWKLHTKMHQACDSANHCATE